MPGQHFISIMGTIGCGKSTAAAILASRLKFELIEENFAQNEFLPRFYQDMPRWAFHSQTFFLMEKISQMMTIEGKLYLSSLIQDTPLFQDVYGYAKTQYVLGNMDKAEWELYLRIFLAFEEYVPKPDCIVYLETSLPVVIERIKKRGRQFEQEIPVGYLKLLDKHNSEWLAKHKTIPILTISTDHLNIVKNIDDQEKLVETVSNFLHQCARPNN